MSKAPPAPGRVTGYTVVLPPDWCRIPVRHGSEKAIRAVVREALKSVPRSVPRDRIAPYQVELESRLRTMVTGARGQGGVDLYLPAGPVHGIPVSASFLVSEGVLGPSGEDVDPVRVVTYLATEDGAGAPVTVDGAAAVRAEHTAPAGQITGNRCRPCPRTRILSRSGSPAAFQKAHADCRRMIKEFFLYRIYAGEEIVHVRSTA
jgi:hypothetical protein